VWEVAGDQLPHGWEKRKERGEECGVEEMGLWFMLIEYICETY